MSWAESWNADPKPFAWTRTAAEFLDSLKRFRGLTSETPH
jgi:hypothetical protein